MIAATSNSSYNLRITQQDTVVSSLRLWGRQFSCYFRYCASPRREICGKWEPKFLHNTLANRSQQSRLSRLFMDFSRLRRWKLVGFHLLLWSILSLLLRLFWADRAYQLRPDVACGLHSLIQVLHAETHPTLQQPLLQTRMSWKWL